MTTSAAVSIVLVLAITACAAPTQGPTQATWQATGQEIGQEVGQATGQTSGQTSGQTPADEAAPVATAAQGGLQLHGSLATRYRGRWGDGQHDQDVYSVLSLDVGDKKQDAWTAYVLAEGALDIDGRSEPSSPFYSLADTQGTPFTSRLYEAYVENHSLKDLSMLRIGRQIDYETPAIVTYDGVKLVSRDLGPSKVRLAAYGGVPSRVYQDSKSGDALYGAFVEADPWKGGHARVDWMHLEDEQTWGDHENDLTALRLDHRFDEHWQVDGGYSRLDGHDRDVALRTSYTDYEDDLVVQASWFRLLETQNDLALEFDPFTHVLLELFPYWRAGLLASKSFGSAFDVQAGADVRRVTNSDDEGEFNHDFERYYSTFTFNDLLPSKIVLSLTGESWNSSSEDISTWGVDLTRKMSDKLEASAGSYFSLYKYDLFLEQERDDVRTYYVRLRLKGKSAVTWDLRYEYEDSFHAYNAVQLGATWHF